MHEDKSDLKQALVYFKKASTICHQALPAQHPDVKQIEQ